METWSGTAGACPKNGPWRCSSKAAGNHREPHNPLFRDVLWFDRLHAFLPDRNGSANWTRDLSAASWPALCFSALRVGSAYKPAESGDAGPSSSPGFFRTPRMCPEDSARRRF